MSSADTPLAAYRRALAEDGFQADAAQRHAAEVLERCHEALHAGRGGPVPGVYLWGPVGRGKTWLMDRFHASLRVPARRLHCHRFMRWVHTRLFELSGTAEPLQALARELAREVRVLCFDEFFVNDIGDAMLLGGLLQLLFAQGLVLVATSNQPPGELYADGFNRERLLPAIAAMERHMHVVAVDGGQDHRLHPGLAHTRYWVAGPGYAGELAAAFARRSAGGDCSAEPVAIGSRRLAVVRHAADALWCRYAQLCEEPLSALDFVALCDRYGAIFVSEVPALGGRQRAAYIARGTEDGAERVLAGERKLPALSAHDDGVRRFIALVDECYDRRLPLYLEAEVPLEALYTEGYLEFPFRRTLSRLQEMQRQRFGAA